MKLKTLKDLIEIHMEGLTGTPSSVVNPIKLKQELGIKYIKELREGNYDILPFEFHDNIGLILLLKHIFNITDEELK